MAGAIAEAGAPQKAAKILNAPHDIAIVAWRDAPMRVTRCRGFGLPVKLPE
jgi:hypothetical protein